MSYYRVHVGLVHYACVCYDVFDLNERYLCMTGKLLSQAFRKHILNKIFTKFFYMYNVLVLKFNCTCRHLISIAIARPQFYRDVDYRARNSDEILVNFEICLSIDKNCTFQIDKKMSSLLEKKSVEF